MAKKKVAEKTDSNSPVVAAQPSDVPPVHGSTVAAHEPRVPCKCLSLDCRTRFRSNQIHYLLKGEPCPLCGENGDIHKVAIIHLVCLDPNEGEIKASRMSGHEGKFFKFMCSSGRYYKTLPPNDPDHPKHFTNNPIAATCLQCLLNFGASLDGSFHVQLPEDDVFAQLMN